MKLSPDFPHHLLLFGFALLKALLINGFASLFFLFSIKNLKKFWPTNNQKRIWLYSSSLFVGIYILLIPFDLSKLWWQLLRLITLSTIAGWGMMRMWKYSKKRSLHKQKPLTLWSYIFGLGFLIYVLIRVIQ